MGSILRTIILGPPGSGKGTICARIVKDFPVHHISSGNILRKCASEKTVLQILECSGPRYVTVKSDKLLIMHKDTLLRIITSVSDVSREIQSILSSGKLVPEDIVRKVLWRELELAKDRQWLLDGYPRTLQQVQNLLLEHPFHLAINLDVPYKVIIDRLKGRWVHVASGRVYHVEFNPPKKWGFDDITGEALIQREDDLPATTTARLSTYDEMTLPVLEYLKGNNLMENFQGSYSNEIWPKVHRYLSKYMKPYGYTHYE